MSSADTTHRSYLFAPGSDPRMMRKALVAGADAVVLDLEDAVAPHAKAAARSEVARLLDELAHSAAQERQPSVHVRVDRTDGGPVDVDLEVAAHPMVEAIRLPKVESETEVRAVADALETLERAKGVPTGRIRLYPTIESARGVLRAEAIAASHPRVARLVLGHADLIADLGASGDDALTLLAPASMLALASRSAGIAEPVDGATTALEDTDVLRAAVMRARALGYFGKSAIHPRQLATIHAGFTPSAEEFASAARIVQAAEAAPDGAIDLDGAMIDAAIVRRARRVLTLRREP